MHVPSESPGLQVCRSFPFLLREMKPFGLPDMLGRWGLGDCRWGLDPTDLFLPSLSEVRSTTLRTISRGELEVDLGRLSFSDGAEESWPGSLKGTSTGFDSERGVWDMAMNEDRANNNSGSQPVSPSLRAERRAEPRLPRKDSVT
jgi:hypothetical protein